MIIYVWDFQLQHLVLVVAKVSKFGVDIRLYRAL